MPLGEIDPQVAELAVPRREHPIARRERVDERCLPPAGAGRGEMNACPVVVLKTFRRSRNRLVASSGNVEERGSSIARFMARRIRSGTFVGPGTNRKLRPGIKSFLNERGRTQRVG